MDCVYVLSAKYGLLPLDEVIAPYDVTLKNATPTQRHLWAAQVLSDLQERHGRVLQGVEFEFHAGEAYRRELWPMLEAAGARCESPVAGLKIGERLRFYQQGRSGLGPTGLLALRPAALRRAPPRAPVRRSAVKSSGPYATTGLKIHVEVWLTAALLHEAGLATFSRSQLKEEIRRRFGDVRHGIDTHLSGHCVANTGNNTGTDYSYLFRTSPGQLRLYRRGDPLDLSRSGMRTAPDEADVPEEYRDIWRRWKEG